MALVYHKRWLQTLGSKKRTVIWIEMKVNTFNLRLDLFLLAVSLPMIPNTTKQPEV